MLDEIGPAHKKKFFVALKLDIGGEKEETFSANSTSIKKAQHAAAELALKQTKFKKPVNRNDKTRKTNEVNLIEDPVKVNDLIKTTQENYKKRANPALAPTVLLNSLAMKLGLVANYTHTLTSASNNVDLDVEAMSSTAHPAEKNDVVQQAEATQIQETNNTSFSSDLNQSFEMKSSNYTNFMKNDYEPFKYPQDVVSSANLSIQEANEPSKSATFNPSQIKVLVNPNKDTFANNTKYNQSNNYNNNYKGLSRIKKRTDNLKQFFYVKLKFAEIEFTGEGVTLQLAKHDAASKALTYYSNAENFLKAKALSTSIQNKNAKAYRPPQFYRQQNENGNF